ncbi:MAG: YeeE/YedE thiosulfate transporter family protein [Gammaproteobacteria bacterium]|nr:YeeE/YedE thiosulfate transporter family protein [Gammaproteobacteria bacterium]
MGQKLLFLALGALFGFLLSRAGATEPELIARLFLFENLHLLWVIASAIAVGALGVALMRKTNLRVMGKNEVIRFENKPYLRTLVPGSLVFGIGWGLTGGCPGTVMAMLGEGKLYVLPIIAGLLAGTWLFGLWRSRSHQAS